MKSIKTILSILLFLTLTANSYATWSLIAVDRKTGEIGIAGASCTFDVSGIASIVPGKGAIVVQAASNYMARMEGVHLMNNDATTQEIISRMMDKRFQPEEQQYGIILLADGTTPKVYSGSEIWDWSGEIVDDDFAVFGNILVGEQVVKKAYEAFGKNRDKSLSERLMMALKAGEEAGGDKRCGKQYAQSAFIMTYHPNDGAITKLAIQGIEKGGKPAVTLLDEKFKRWYNKDENH